jgi:tetratricopeptide (TPR) repeat protein
MSSTGTANRMTKHPTRGCVPLSGIVPRTFLWLAFAVLCLAFLSKLRAQEPPVQGPPANPFDHYTTAKTLLAKGEEGQASAEFQTFLIEVLHQLATAAAEAGNFAKASPWFEEALILTPKDADLRMEYARTAFQGVRLPEARRLAEEAVRLEPDNPQTRLLLGQVLYQLHDLVAARSQLETVFAKNPDFGTGYLLGKTDLLLHEDKAARALFDTMLRQWGDTPINHIFLGRAYSQSGYKVEAAAEFQQALTMDPHVRGAHYQLGLSYLRDDEAAEYDQAIPQFRAELDLDPNDFPSHSMLGSIAVKQSRWSDAEKELLRATALNPNDVPSLLALADTYLATNRPEDAGSTLRKVVALAGARTDQDIARAHYLLGRLLLRQSGHLDEAKQEFALVADMQKASGSVLTADSRAAGSGSVLREEQAVQPVQPAATQPASAQPPKDESVPVLSQVGQAADRFRSTIADAYNNLGAIAGNAHDFPSAANYFRRARQWDASLPGLEHNLGMAFFYTARYREAAPLLRTYIETNPADRGGRAALAFSQFNNEDFSAVVETVRPIQDSLDKTPKLAFVYAASLARTGAAGGIDRLQALEAANPSAADIHHELALAYQRAGRSIDAERETNLSRGLNKQDSNSELPK